MFKAECKKVITYDLQISEDIVKFCQWMLDEDQFDTLYDNYAIADLIDAIANEAPSFEIGSSEIDIKYYK